MEWTKQNINFIYAVIVMSRKIYSPSFNKHTVVISLLRTLILLILLLLLLLL